MINRAITLQSVQPPTCWCILFQIDGWWTESRAAGGAWSGLVAHQRRGKPGSRRQMWWLASPVHGLGVGFAGAGWS